MGPISLQRILLADDEPDILEISRIALETVGGFEVSVCSSGSSLLERMTEFKPDLVNQPIQFRGVSVYEVIATGHRLREYQQIIDRHLKKGEVIEEWLID